MCGLNENVPHWLISSNTWSSASRIVWEGLGSCSLVGEGISLGGVFEVSKDSSHSQCLSGCSFPLPLLPFSPPSNFQIKIEVPSFCSSVMPASLLPCSLKWWPWTLTLPSEPQIKPSILKVVLIMVSLHINRKVRQKENNEMTGMIVHDFNPSTQETEAGRSPEQLGQHRDTRLKK